MSQDILEKVYSILPGFELCMVSQGAEALVFISPQHPYLPKNINPVNLESTEQYIIKYRPRKPYRHEQLDLQITKSRTASEAKLLYKLETLGIRAPKLIAMDAINGIIFMEFLGFKLENNNFSSLKNWLWYIETKGDNDALGIQAQDVMRKVGIAIAKLHLNDIVHGDLTSSNIVLTKDSDDSLELELALIDFGLSSYSGLAEDKAVDLYVLERALLSTHSLHAEKYGEWLLDGYHSTYSKTKKSQQWIEVERRLKLVRMRGRKRSMLG
ncbi:serine/threonine-protein kinase bud32 [Pichia californica]|nr:serine/threonine-protein kinase bud32 [[Candida] californica]